MVFQLGPGVENDDVYRKTSTSLGKALSQIEQRAVGGNLDGFTFGGTNTILEGNRLIFIKDGESGEWSDSAAAKDVRAVVPSERGGAQMKIANIEGTTEEIKNFFQDNGLRAEDFFEPAEQPIGTLWFVLPGIFVFIALAVLTFSPMTSINIGSSFLWPPVFS